MKFDSRIAYVHSASPIAVSTFAMENMLQKADLRTAHRITRLVKHTRLKLVIFGEKIWLNALTKKAVLY